ncbi:MAG: hypothetical protein QOD59_2775, partial [Mycobacterium sp.]|nr:hypothetical protein [Mycobacterium sp.]
ATSVVVGVLAIACLGAGLRYHCVEEPARVWLRLMVKTRAAQPTEAADPAHGRLQPLHGPRHMPTDTVATRAG